MKKDYQNNIKDMNTRAMVKKTNACKEKEMVDLLLGNVKETAYTGTRYYWENLRGHTVQVAVLDEASITAAWRW